MTTAEDQFRDFFRSVTPTTFPPCPTPPAAVPSSQFRQSRRQEWYRRSTLAIAASLLLVLTILMLPKGNRPAITQDPTMLKDATADGKALQGNAKNSHR